MMYEFYFMQILRDFLLFILTNRWSSLQVDNMDKATASSTIKDQRPDIFKTIDTKLKRGGGKEKEELMCC